MYTLIQQVPLRQLVIEQFPAFAISLLIAEFFYKFHSFTLECLAFLGTWFVIDFAIRKISGKFPSMQSD